MEPNNLIAETISRLQKDNIFFEAEIEKNNLLIEQLSPMAEWSESKTDTPPTK